MQIDLDVCNGAMTNIAEKAFTQGLILGGVFIICVIITIISARCLLEGRPTLKITAKKKRKKNKK